MEIKVKTKKGTQAEKIDIHLFDDTAEATLTLWGCLCPSSAAWKPSYTVLLISYPELKNDRGPILSLRNGTYMNVDPLITDATWLRRYALGLTKKEHVNHPFPEDSEPRDRIFSPTRLIHPAFDLETALSAEIRILFTLADIDELYVCCNIPPA